MSASATASAVAGVLSPAASIGTYALPKREKRAPKKTVSWRRGKIATPRSGAVELAFFGDAFESLTGTLDPVLIVVTLRRQQLHHRVAARRRRSAKRRRGVIDNLANLILVRADRNLVRGDRLHRRALRPDHLCCSALHSRDPVDFANRRSSGFRRLFCRRAYAFRTLLGGTSGGLGRPSGGFC